MGFLNKLFEQQQNAIDFSFLKTDMHSHLIPGIDDGAKDLEDSVRLIKGMTALGFRKLITTPHTFQDYYPNTREIIMEGYHKVSEELKKRQIDIDFRVASEYFLDDNVISLIKKNVPLLTISGNKVLVELSMVIEPEHRDEFLFAMRSNGYEPIIAHVERYQYYHHRFEEYERLVTMGYNLQVNLLSFTGSYGKRVKETAHKLLSRKLVKYLGTDLHHARHLKLLSDMSHQVKLMKELTGYPWLNNQL